jgi:hypothetical protein
MTSFISHRHADRIGPEDFEARIEKALRGNETVYVLDDVTLLRISEHGIETTSF